MWLYIVSHSTNIYWNPQFDSCVAFLLGKSLAVLLSGLLCCNNNFNNSWEFLFNQLNLYCYWSMVRSLFSHFPSVLYDFSYTFFKVRPHPTPLTAYELYERSLIPGKIVGKHILESYGVRANTTIINNVKFRYCLLFL